MSSVWRQDPIVKDGFIKKDMLFFYKDDKSVFLKVFDELIAMTGYPLACLFYNGKGIFLALGSNKKFGI
jgi:hypothetical protein